MWHYTNPVVIHWTDDLAATLPALIIPGKGLLFVYSPAFLDAHRGRLEPGMARPGSGVQRH